MEISTIVLMMLGVFFLIGSDFIIQQINKISKQRVHAAKFIILFFSVGSTLLGVLSTIMQNHINVYTFFPFYALLLAFFVKQSSKEFKKLKTKVGKTEFIIHSAIGSYFLLAVGIYVYFMAPFANMM